MNEELSRLASSVARNMQALMGNSGALPPELPFLSKKTEKRAIYWDLYVVIKEKHKNIAQLYKVYSKLFNNIFNIVSFNQIV